METLRENKKAETNIIRTTFIVLLSVVCLVQVAPIYFVLILVGTKDKNIIKHFTLFYDQMFNGFFRPIEHVFGVDPRGEGE